MKKTIPPRKVPSKAAIRRAVATGRAANEAALDWLGAALAHASPEEERFWADRRQRGAVWDWINAGDWCGACRVVELR